MEAHKSGNKQVYKKAKYEVEREIRRAKQEYKRKLESQFCSNNTRALWQGLQTAVAYKKSTAAVADVDPQLPDKLNEFYSRFDRQNTTPVTIVFPDAASPLPAPFVVEEGEVRNLFKRQNSRKAACPDGVSTAVLKNCSQQLSPVFTDIFNLSLQLSTVPLCFKTSTIIPVPKKARTTSLNDYRPVALTSVAMKVLERIVLKHIKSLTQDKLDPLQFAYRENRSVDDAVALALHFVLQHLESPNRYARILFIDYSSAFNTIIPQKLYNKLKRLGLPASLCFWLLNFLLNRPQTVKINNCFSNSVTLNTGTPQGCVLSPILYSLFTNDCVSHHQNVQIIKFADDKQ